MMDRAREWVASLDGEVVGGRYRLGKPLGLGGMGAVFQGVHQAMGRPVAIKLLMPELIDSNETIRRFQQEAQAAAAIARRGVVDILDFDVDERHGPYLVMEHLAGQSLLRRIKTEGKLDLFHALTITVQMTDTLAAVHERGIIHRDLKPANVFLALTEEGEEVVKLLDFGISRVAPSSGATPLTIPGTILGTPRFMAPEQARCDPDIDHRADLYSVGMILYYALSGVKPFAGHPQQGLMLKVVREGPKPLRELGTALPEGVYRFVDRAIQRDRERRYQSALEMRADLLNLTDRLPSRGSFESFTFYDDNEPTNVEGHPLLGDSSSDALPTTVDRIEPSYDDDDSETASTISQHPNIPRNAAFMPAVTPLPKTFDSGSSVDTRTIPQTQVSPSPLLNPPNLASTAPQPTSTQTPPNIMSDEQPFHPSVPTAPPGEPTFKTGNKRKIWRWIFLFLAVFTAALLLGAGVILALRFGFPINFE